MVTFFSNQLEFRKWLEKNHLKESELLVGYYKVNTKIPSMTWSESVDQALCFGWIDGVRKSIDKDSYCIRFTPRRNSSIWSAINIGKVESLLKQGLMTSAGNKAYSSRTESKSKIYSYENEPVQLSVNYEKTFKANKLAWNYFSKQAPSYQKLTIHWIMDAKQELTQLKRLNKTIVFSEQQKRV